MTRARSAAAVRELDDDPLGALDDVVVRQDAAVGVDDEAAAGAAARRIAIVARRPKSNGRRTVGRSGSERRGRAGALADPRGRVDVHDGRVDPLDDVREVDERTADAAPTAGGDAVAWPAWARGDAGADDRRPASSAAGEDGADQKRDDGASGQG